MQAVREEQSAGPAVSSSDPARLSTDRLMKVFGALEAPLLEEMDGEYASKILRQSFVAADIGARLILSNPLALGIWRSKSFRPVDASVGRGYNTFRQFGRTVHRLPMQTLVAPSRYDGRLAYQLVYRAYHSICGELHVVDELRRLTPDTYLGIGTWGFTPAMRRVPYPFLLEGPVGPYRADVGRARRSYSVEAEVPAFGPGR